MIRLWHCDSIPMKEIKFTPDTVVITDPPYGDGKYETDVAVPMEYYRWLVETFKTTAIFGYPETLVGICIGIGKKPDEWITWNPTNKKLKASKNRLPKYSECIAVFGETPGASLLFDKREKPLHPMIISKRLADGKKYDPDKVRVGDVWNDFSPNWGFHSHKRRHPNEKPLSLMKKLVVLCSNEGDVIFDPFMGSGTTGEAAIPLGRGFAGIEKELAFYKIAEQVIIRAKAQLSLRIPTLPAPDGGDSAPSQTLSTPDMFSAIEHEPTPAPRR